MGHPVRIKLTNNGLLALPANHCTSEGAPVPKEYTDNI